MVPVTEPLETVKLARKWFRVVYGADVTEKVYQFPLKLYVGVIGAEGLLELPEVLGLAAPQPRRARSGRSRVKRSLENMMGP